MEDKFIVCLYHQRDEQAVAETQSKYGAQLHRVSWKFVRDRRDAEECVNDTYLTAWNTMPPERPQYLFAFLAKITRHLSLNRMQYRKAQKRDALVQELSQELLECIPNPQDGMGEYQVGEVAASISTFLKGCDETAQAVFVRRYWYGDSIAEIAVQYRMTQSRVKSMLFRTRNRLKEWLQKEGIAI